MDLFLTALILGEISIAAAEISLWVAFRAKAGPISYPHETDMSSLRFFTFGRLRLVMLAHALMLGIILLLLFLLLW